MAAFKDLLGDTLLSSAGGETLKTEDALAGKEVVGLYFSAHWCPPCRGYTPVLAELYKKMAAEKPGAFEVVFVSSDKQEGEFTEYFGEHPWRALPFSERERKAELSKKYKVRGIPTLVLLDGATGELISTEGRALATDPADFPWKPPTLKELLAGDFHKPAGSAELEALPAAEHTLLYFSAHWCPPCRRATPLIAKAFSALKEAGKSVEALFVTSDRDEGQFDEYRADMPWHAIPFGQRALCQKLGQHFNCQGIPMLVVLDAELNVVNANAVPMAAGTEAVESFPWAPPLVLDLDEDPSDINDTPSVVVLMEKAEGEWDRVEAALEEAAKGLGKAKAVNFYTAKEVGGISGQVRKLCNLGPASAKPQCVLLDLDDQGGFYSGPEEVNASTVAELVAAYQKGGVLERQQVKSGR